MDAQQKIRVDQHAFERELDPVIEAATVLTALIEELK